MYRHIAQAEQLLDGGKVRTEMQRPQLAERASQQAKLRGRNPKAGEAAGQLNCDNDRKKCPTTARSCNRIGNYADFWHPPTPPVPETGSNAGETDIHPHPLRQLAAPVKGDLSPEAAARAPRAAEMRGTRSRHPSHTILPDFCGGAEGRGRRGRGGRITDGTELVQCKTLSSIVSDAIEPRCGLLPLLRSCHHDVPRHSSPLRSDRGVRDCTPAGSLRNGGSSGRAVSQLRCPRSCGSGSGQQQHGPCIPE